MQTSRTSQPRRIYLDNAATSWPKPESVYGAVEHYMRQVGAPAGRGVYREATDVERSVGECRRLMAEQINAVDASRIVFTLNATDALNLALHGLLRPGDHVVTSTLEHNSVLRPLRALEDAGVVRVTRVGCNGAGWVSPDEIRAAIEPQTRLIALLHASNVTGALQDVVEVGRIAARHECVFLVDAAQTVGHVPVDVREMGVHLLATAGHKGLLGPLGTGCLYVAPGMDSELRSVRQGGTGTRSDLDLQPDSMPDKYESGNLNVPGVLGLAAGLKFVRDFGIAPLRAHHLRLTGQMLRGLSDISGVRIHGPADPERQVGVVSMTLRGYDPRELAGLLDSVCRIQARPGIHCAPGAHRELGTLQAGGTVRFSFGPFTTVDEIDRTVEAIAEFAATTLEC